MEYNVSWFPRTADPLDSAELNAALGVLVTLDSGIHCFRGAYICFVLACSCCHENIIFVDKSFLKLSININS